LNRWVTSDLIGKKNVEGRRASLPAAFFARIGQRRAESFPALSLVGTGVVLDPLADFGDAKRGNPRSSNAVHARQPCSQR
jgi:hypothetical protein